MLNILSTLNPWGEITDMIKRSQTREFQVCRNFIFKMYTVGGMIVGCRFYCIACGDAGHTSTTPPWYDVS